LPENEGSHIRDTNMTGCMPALHSISDVKDEGHEFQKVLPIRKLEDPLPAARNRCLLLLLAFVTSIGLNVWPGDVRSTRPKKKKQHRDTVWQPELPHIRNYVHHLDGPFLASEIMSIIWTDQTHCGISDSTLIQLYMNLGTLHESRNKLSRNTSKFFCQCNSATLADYLGDFVLGHWPCKNEKNDSEGIAFWPTKTT
jgi:hypothetical protein